MIKKFIIWWICNIAAFAVAAYLIGGIHFRNPWALILAALVFGIVNILLKPILFILSIPAMIFSLGLFYFVVNALVFWAVTAIVPGFVISGFWPAFFGASVVSLANSVLGMIFRK